MSYLTQAVVAESRSREALAAYISLTGVGLGGRAPRFVHRALHQSSGAVKEAHGDQLLIANWLGASLRRGRQGHLR